MWGRSPRFKGEGGGGGGFFKMRSVPFIRKVILRGTVGVMDTSPGAYYIAVQDFGTWRWSSKMLSLRFSL